MLTIFRFHAAEEIDFDVDLRKIQRGERFDGFCGFLRDIGRCPGTPVLMGPEGGDGHPVLGFDSEADRVVLLTESPFA